MVIHSALTLMNARSDIARAALVSTTRARSSAGKLIMKPQNLKANDKISTVTILKFFYL
jgi:hypothetical protein